MGEKLHTTPPSDLAMCSRFDSGKKLVTAVNVPKVSLQGQPLHPANQPRKQ